MGVSQYDKIDYAAYKPISMQEMWAPAAMLREQQDKLQEDYSNAEQLAQQGFSGLNPEVDKEALGIQKQFMDQTKIAADELATKGFIDSGRRRSLLQLKSVYTNQVAPLQQQIALRASRAEELRKIQQEHPDFISVGSPMSVGLTKGIKDPNAYNYIGMKGDILTKSVADKAVELGKRIEGMPKYRHTNIPFNMFALLKSGASAQDVGNAMLHAGYKDEDAKGIVGELQNIVRSTLDQYGVDQKFGQDPTALKKAYDFANAGLYKAIGDNKPMSAEDQWGLYMAKQKAEEAPALPKIPVSLNPNMEDGDEFTRLNKLKNASLGKAYEVVESGNKSVTGGGMLLAKPNGMQSKNDSQQEIYNMARTLGIGIPAWAKTGKAPGKEWETFATKVIDEQKSRLKSATPIFTIATGDDNISKSIYQAIQSGSVILPKSGNEELNADKYNILKKTYGNPIMTLSPAGNGVEIKFGNGKSYKADNSIFQNQLASNAVKSVIDFTTKYRPLILDPMKNIDKQPNVRKSGNDYLMDLSEYGKGVVQFPKSFVRNGGLSKYLSALSSEISGNTLGEVFSNVASQNQGLDIKF